MTARLYVLSGQFGWSGTMFTSLAPKLAAFGKVTTHLWDDSGILPDALSQPPNIKLVLIGGSLGGNQVPYLGLALRPRAVAAIVAYDPSRQSPLVHLDHNSWAVQDVSLNVKAALCWWNPYTWWLGGSKLVGSQVTTRQINKFHLLAFSDEQMHLQTVNWVRQTLSA